jgi:hypothetical protein
MSITIHQPEHLIWLGLVDKIKKTDTFVVLDNVQFRKNYFQNRNKIRTVNGWGWLTVPVKKHSLHTPIKDIEISYDLEWTERYFGVLKMAYGKTKFYDEYFPIIREIIEKKHVRLSDLNLELINFILSAFGVDDKKIIKASTLELPDVDAGNNGEKIVLEICKQLKTDVYISGPLGKEYTNLKEFKDNHISLVVHEFHHPIYRQYFEPFIPGMSAIDILFNYGPEAKNILWNIK